MTPTADDPVFAEVLPPPRPGQLSSLHFLPCSGQCGLLTHRRADGLPRCGRCSGTATARLWARRHAIDNDRQQSQRAALAKR